MRLTRKQFDKKLKDGTLVLAFIGMSGVGKTRSARLVSRAGLTRIACDGVIAGRLANAGVSASGVADIGTWMGQPYAPGFREKEQEYLRREEDVLVQALNDPLGNTVIDTTGSVIYVSEKVLNVLKKSALIVHLEATEAFAHALFERYLHDPKPVVWGDRFDRLTSESERDALARCYPKLLEFRAQRYRALADVSVPSSALESVDKGVEVLDRIGTSLR